MSYSDEAKKKLQQQAPAQRLNQKYADLAHIGRVLIRLGELLQDKDKTKRLVLHPQTVSLAVHVCAIRDGEFDELFHREKVMELLSEIRKG